MTDRRVHLLPTCVVGELRPAAAHAAARLLGALDLDVHVPRGVLCCGQPALNAGFRDEAARVAEHGVERLGAAGPIVLPSGSCTHAITHGWPTLLEGPGVDDVVARTHELSSFLVAHGALERLTFRLDATATYHPSCHLLRGLRGDDPPRRLLGAVEGLTLLPLPDAEECCGFGGSFAVDREPISIAMMGRKLDAVASTGADILTATDASCLMHLEGGQRRRGGGARVLHLAELLAEALV